MTAFCNDTYKHEIVTELGAHLRVVGEHGRIYLMVREPGSRIWLTVPIPLDPADELFERGREIIAVQRSDIEQRGA